MRSALIIPTESPVDLTDVKVALLIYETVTLIDPSDRDLFPPSGMQLALGMPPFYSAPGRSIRLLGKTNDYDAEFDRLVELLRPAIVQGSVVIKRTYAPIRPIFSIGSVDMGDFPMDVSALLQLYRSAATEQSFLEAAIRGDRWLLSLPEEVIGEIAIFEGSADGAINDSAPLPNLTSALAREDLRQHLTAIARARLASAIKMAGYATTQGLVPHGGSRQHDNILRLVSKNAHQFLDQLAEADPYWVNRSRSLRVIHDEYIDRKVLKDLSIADVLKFRTRLWGEQASRKDAMLRAVSAITRETAHEPPEEFEKAVAKSIRDYRQKAAELEDEREGLNFKVMCEIGKTILGGAAGTAAGSLASVQTSVSAAALLFSGCLYAFRVFQELLPVSQKLRNAENEFGDDVRFAINNFYDPSS